ncbi:MAG: hypothetical protein AAB686_02640, partial [Patescibacteria group bacterium]
MKKLVLFGIILIVIIVLFAVYALIFGGSEQLSGLWQKVGLNGQSSPDGGKAFDNAIVAISERAAMNPILSFGQDRIYYFDAYGQLYRNALVGKSEEVLSIPNVQMIEGVLWPDSGNNFITVGKTAGYDGDYLRLYLAKNSQFRDLGINVESVAWLAGGEKYVYVWRRGDGGRELKTAVAETNQY